MVKESYKVEEFFRDAYKEELKRHKNHDKLEGMKRSFENATKNAYETFVEKHGAIEKDEFIVGFHRFYDKIEKEISEEEENREEKKMVLEKLQQLDYNLYKEKKDYLEPIKKYLGLLVAVNVILFLSVGYFVYEKVNKTPEITKEKPAEKPGKKEDIKKKEIPKDYFALGEKAHKEKKYKEAFENYEKAYEAGNRKVLYRLGTFYFKGYGVEKDNKKAYEYWLKASDYGNAEAYYSLGIANIKGYGVERNKEKAMFYLLKASELGNKESNYSIGNIYYLEKKYEDAFVYWEKGYKMGDKESGRSLANLYRYGLGVEKNSKKAKEIMKDITE